MGPEIVRKRSRIAAFVAAPCALLAAEPAWAAVQPELLTGLTPSAVAGGAVGFAVLASLLVRRWHQSGSRKKEAGQARLSEVRAQLDEYEALLSSMPEVTVMWPQAGSCRVLGPVSAVLPPGRRPEAVLDFFYWLGAEDAAGMGEHVERLKAEGVPFDCTLTALDGRIIRASGRVFGGAAALRLRPATVSDARDQPDQEPRHLADSAGAGALLAPLSEAAFIRDAAGVLVYGNKAYLQLADRLGKKGKPGSVPDLFAPAAVKQQLKLVEGSAAPAIVPKPLGELPDFELTLLPLADGSAGLLRRKSDAAEVSDPGFAPIGTVIEALPTPVAVFDARRRLVHFNRAYVGLWQLDAVWLRTCPDEREILDRLRGEGGLPSESDYRAWRAEHLASYSLKAMREKQWHLPNGHTLNVLAAPASDKGGVIYVFDDLTERLALESRNRALLNVQRESLNALNEAVAVFGTNGRLTLSNPKLSSLWKLPMNALEQHPHIDQLADAAATALPQDGAKIWQELKRRVVDLNPARSDDTGRINRADGRLLDYAVVRLPDGQTLITFMDVTESANYSRVLKERNDALITADRLKDAFVQNVSYELRSPLTNIIGFADLLGSEAAGPLNARQHEYADYIRASSASLGVLVDNILDLATVDAGVAQLDIGSHDVAGLVDKARKGLAASYLAPATESPLNLLVDVPKDLPPLQADGTRVVQILYNLLSNAARYSPPGTEIRLSARVRGDRILFTVEDEGAGIPEELRAAVFQRFEGFSVEGRQRGAGLGLSIVKTFAHLHGGTISVEEREPSGTRVIVNLPLEVASLAGAAQ